MVEQLTGLGYAIIGFAILVGIGIVILSTLSTNLATCPSTFTFNSSSRLCMNSTGDSAATSTATSTIDTITGYLGTSNGGLASWIPIVIVMVIGLLFLGWFLTKKGHNA